MQSNNASKSSSKSLKIKSTKGHEKGPDVLLVGYNGANNTGSEARLLSIIEDIRALFRNNVNITVPSLNEENLRRYLNEDKNLRIIRLPSIFFGSLRRLVKEHDLMMLVEGSCYMDTWTSALLWAFLWATRCAYIYQKPSIAYAVDAGKFSTFNKYLVKRYASKTDLIITRTNAAADILKSIGVKAPIEVTADTAFKFNIKPEDEDILFRIWPETEKGVIGFAVIDFSLWPVVIRPWGRKEHLYQWPYYFSHSGQRSQARERLAKGWATEADRLIEKYDKNIALICMEELDEALAQKILSKILKKDHVRIFSSRKFHASQMTSILRNLELLVTSRYHAAVLSLKAAIPQIAVGHDTRLESLYHEMGLFDNFFIGSTSRQIWGTLTERLENLIENHKNIEKILKKGYEEHLARSKQNPELLREFLVNRGWGK
jgi:polysaccharide pyruvyl transferase WcaK-like protein